MTLKKEIIRTFGFFALIVGIIFGIIYLKVNSSNNRELKFEQLGEKASVSSQLMNDIVNQTQSAYQLLISDQDILAAVHTLSKKGSGSESYESTYFSDAYSTIRVGINSYYIYKNFYRMIFFNQNGDVIAGRNIQDGIADSSVSFSDIGWTDRVKQGSLTFIPCHTDDWGAQKRTVMSIVKGLVGENMGYIEVQWLKDDLDEYFAPEEYENSILFYNTDGELLYSYGDYTDVDYFSYVKEAGFNNISKDLKSENIMFASHFDSNNQIVTVAAVSASEIDLLGAVIPSASLIIIVFMILGLGYVTISSSRISRPISDLRNVMESTDLDKITSFSYSEDTYEHPVEEIRVLYQSYYEMLKRLSDSVKKEKQFSDLQLQAQFDLLQAQVNPHFLYNVLNVLSSRGITANDEGICEICSSLGEMLRYSTNARQKTSSIKEEADYMRSYLKLMKYRYEDRLEYSINILPEIEEISIPKVVLEQFAENSFKYRNLQNGNVIKISVSSDVKDGCWTVSVKDNGTGFGKEKLEELERSFRDVRKRLSSERKNIELEIGGMGLVGVYARLYMHFNESLVFSIDSNNEGSVITFGSKTESKETNEV